jgi:putative transposase
MAHTYSSIIIHYAFSTKNRHNIITPDLQPRLWSYMGGIARENKMKALVIGGIKNHVHILLSLPATISIAKAIQLIKGGSSTWVSKTFSEHKNFTWREGYGAFSIGVSQKDDTIDYINNQKEHHHKKTFQEEFISFLHKHKIEYDERYIWK